MFLEHIANGLVTDVITDVRQRTLDSIVTPVRIFRGEAKDQVDNHLANSWPADAFPLFAVIPFLGNQHTMPTQDRVRCEQRADFRESLPAEDLAFDRQSTSLIVIQQDPLLAVRFLEQFENLILNNLDAIVRRLDIPPESILSASPYFQRKTQRHDACQIDLLIHTRNTLYVCEVKFRNRIDADVMDEVQRKIEKLPGRSKYSVRPVLIYEGDLAPAVQRSDCFCRLISAADLLDRP